MLPVVWSETADEDLAVITDFIGRRNFVAAERCGQKYAKASFTYLNILTFTPPANACLVAGK